MKERSAWTWLDTLLESFVWLSITATLVDVAFVTLAFGLFRLSHVDFQNSNVRGQYQDVFTGVLTLAGVLVGSGFAAFALVTQNRPRPAEVLTYRRRLKGLSNSLYTLVWQGLFLAFVALYLLAKANLSDIGDQIIMASLIPLVPTVSVSFFLLVRSAIRLRMHLP